MKYNANCAIRETALEISVVITVECDISALESMEKQKRLFG